MKIIVSDMDGTLLSHDQYGKNLWIDERVIKSINSFSSGKNVVFNIATGRHYLNVKKILSEYKIKLSKKSFIIGMNGSQIFSVEKNCLIKSFFLDGKKLMKNKAIFEYLEKIEKEIILFGYDENNRIVFLKNKNKDFEELKQRIIGYYMSTGNVFTFHDADKYTPNIKLYKICICIFDGRDLIELSKKMNEKFPDFQFVRTAKIFLEILEKDITKGSAVDYINKKYFKEHKENIYTIGDSDNDIEMFALSKNSYTRSDTDEHVKKSASNIIEHKASEFVYYAIEDILKKEEKQIKD